MRESYRKGVANHPGPEPCEGSREAALEALDRGIYRLGIELRKRKCGEPTVSPQPEARKYYTNHIRIKRMGGSSVVTLCWSVIARSRWAAMKS